ncbi:hypothetical protein [Vibrio sp. qd031]|uniref:hypothetical protein n=1 Tax=Vibrio sp. qd031 TaxID=1603038 RepID=UPI000A0F59FE|nr:hypothetical protein [Vibrio sp. qd031]
MATLNQKLLITLVATTFIAGCGGSSDSGDDAPQNPVSTSAYTGVFVDSPVGGMFYQTESYSGYTNSLGEFSYLPGETVQFSIGSIMLPAVQAGDIITPLTLARTSDTDNSIAINIARVLQTLDSDGNPNNGIDISTDMHQVLADQNLDINFDDDSFDTAYNSFVSTPGLNKQPVDADVAKAHLEQTLSDIAPVEFTTEWLSGKTLYLVMFGEGDVGGEEPENVSVVAQLTFNSDSTISYTGLVNDDNVDTIGYSLEDGKLAFYDDGEVDYTEIVCGSTKEYLKTHSTHHDTINGAELFFYNKQTALDYAKRLTQDIPVCMSEAYNTIPTLDNTNNWDEVEPMIIDPTGDAGLSAYDVTAVYLAQNETTLFIRYHTAGSERPPVANHYANRWIHFRSQSGYALAVEAFYFNGAEPAILYDVSNDAEYDDYMTLADNLPVTELNQVITIEVPKSHIDTSKVYEVDFFTHYSNLSDTWEGEDETENDRGRVNYVSFW